MIVSRDIVDKVLLPINDDYIETVRNIKSEIIFLRIKADGEYHEQLTHKGFRTRRIHFSRFQTDQTVLNRENRAITGKFTWLTTWLTMVSKFFSVI